jgi:hypothetical protein
MYLLASGVVNVECSSAKSFDYAANLENFADWFPGVINVSSDNELPYATVGKRYRETVAVPLQGRRSVLIRVVDANPPRRITTEGDLPILLPRMELEFHELGPDSCEIYWRMLSRNSNLTYRYTALPFARWVMSRRAKTGLRSLKRLLERHDST